jgi:glycosyltransferase involved in cell wall biosynthesis
VWELGQRAALRRAACIHATSEAEYEDIRAAGLRNPVAVIPNGVDLPEADDGKTPRSRVVLALGRIHPKKALASLVRAWRRVEAVHPDWRLRIVGPAENGYDLELVGLARRFGLKTVTVEGPVFGKAKLEVYRQASLFVLPTLSENFGLVVAEALAAGTPVVSTKGAPWRGLEEEGCGWWVDHGDEALSQALLTALALTPQALSRMGESGRCWMSRDFAWRRIGQQMEDVYHWLALSGEPPASVRFA